MCVSGDLCTYQRVEEAVCVREKREREDELLLSLCMCWGGGGMCMYIKLCTWGFEGFCMNVFSCKLFLLVSVYVCVFSYPL